MMYFKAKLFNDHASKFAILEARMPNEHKALGRQVAGFDQGVWDKHKIKIVTEITEAKFIQNENLRRDLFATGDAVIVDVSPTDAIWGIGLDETDANRIPPDLWPGQNLLGKILMDVRDELRLLYPDEVKNA